MSNLPPQAPTEARERLRALAEEQRKVTERLIAEHYPVVLFGGTAFVRGAFVNSEAWSEVKPDGSFRFAHAREWLDEMYALYGQVESLRQQRDEARGLDAERANDSRVLTEFANLVSRSARFTLRRLGATFPDGLTVDRVADTIAISVGMSHGLLNAMREVLDDVAAAEAPR